MVTTVTTISRISGERSQSVTPVALLKIESVTLWEPELEDVVALQKRGNVFITVVFRKVCPPRKQIKEFFEAGVGQIDICIGE